MKSNYQFISFMEMIFLFIKKNLNNLIKYFYLFMVKFSNFYKNYYLNKPKLKDYLMLKYYYFLLLLKDSFIFKDCHFNSILKDYYNINIK